jgi:hypothetical protein
MNFASGSIVSKIRGIKMFSEKDMEDAIWAHPEKYLGEKELTRISRQYRIGKYIFDLLFQNRHGAKLIVEIQKGTLDMSHTHKILDYYLEYKENNPDAFIELMVIANRIPYERRRRLDHDGIEWKEIPESEFLGPLNNLKNGISIPKPPEPLGGFRTPTADISIRTRSETGRSAFGHGDGTQGQVMDDAIISLVKEGKEVTAEAVWSIIKNVRNDIKGLARVKDHFGHLKRFHSWDGKGYASTEHKAR